MGKRTKRPGRVRTSDPPLQYAHFDDIRGEIRDMVERLCELHDETDPRKGAASEVDKHDKAQRAIAIWWYIYAKVMLWAQSHIIGHEMAKWNEVATGVLATRRGGDVNCDSHELEALGSLWACNRQGNDEYTNELSETLDEAGVSFDDAATRRVIERLLYSMSSDSSVWRFPLSNGLRALNHGETVEFLKPAQGRRRGSPYALDHARANAIAHVYFLMGRGLKKHVALSRVGDAVAASVETLRDWEKRLQRDDWFAFMWNTAFVAGVLDENPYAIPGEDFEIVYHGIDTNVEVARRWLPEFKEAGQLKRLRAALRRHHSKHGG